MLVCYAAAALTFAAGVVALTNWQIPTFLACMAGAVAAALVGQLLRWLL
jgi:hypothetical protein